MKHILFSGACAMLASTAYVARAADGPPTPFIVVDQFGYLPDAPKVAVVRDPEVGFDNDWRFTPGKTYQVVDSKTEAVVFSGTPVAWNNGAVDPSSGDHVWRFDFSAVTTPGRYVVRDAEARYDSAPFDIAANVYKPVLVQAMRFFYYQRAGFAKDAKYAGTGWADGASHLRSGQDTEARLYSRKGDGNTARDVHGGWYDAGDFNKYTSWTARYVITLLNAYDESPAAFTDDFNIPESGNGVPDLLDEVKWGTEWLVRMQNADGAMLSVVGLASGSPPSSATGPSFYGPPTTLATLNGAGAFARAARIYGADPRFTGFAADLKARALKAWAWADAHPAVTFYNNDARDHSEGLAAGQQEGDDYDRRAAKLQAAVYLFDLTGDTVWRDYVDAHYRDAGLYARHANIDFNYEQNAPLLVYAAMKDATPAVADDIRKTFAGGFEGDGWRSMARDPYGAWIGAYTWGSSAVKSYHGNIFADEARYGLSQHTKAEAMDAAAGYIHYLHGVNPLGKVYLSNMKAFGATNSVDRFYHTWFAHGSGRWDSVAHSQFGPPPGYVVGGPNPSYSWDKRCPDVNAGCGRAMPSPPYGQPAEKSYADFNDSWPINSWEVTEPSGAYQTAYIRLLARFVN